MKENEIRPNKEFAEYLNLCNSDIQLFFDDCKTEKINCPACDRKGKHSFDKCGFSYDYCDNCGNLYVNPRPAKEYFENYYTNGESIKYWVTTFYEVTKEARRQKIWVPKAKLICNILNEKLKTIHFSNIVDIGAGYGLFLQEFLKIYTLVPYSIEPNDGFHQILINSGFHNIKKFVEDINLSDLPNGNSIWTSFELFEHVHSPFHFLKCIYDKMKTKDIFVFTTLSSHGYDILNLWDQSKSVSPPHHLNFFNPNSLEYLAQKIGFEVIEIITPGELDVSIVDNTINELTNRWAQHISKNCNEGVKQNFQRFLQSNKLSSHMMCFLQRID